MIAAELSHRDLGNIVAFDYGDDIVAGWLVWIVLHPAAVTVTLKHHGEPYDLPPTHPVHIEEPMEASKR